MKKLFIALAVYALSLPAFSQIVSTNLVIHYGLDTTDNDVWEELVGLFPNNDRTALNRTGASDLPARVQLSSSTNSISGYYDYQVDNSGQVMHLGVLNAADSYNDTIGAGFDTRNTSFEIWFRPRNATTPRQILWETGGGTGVSFTLNTTNLQFRTRSGNQVANVVTDISAEIASRDWIQAVGTIDFGTESVELFVNGASVGTGTAAGNISDWDGGDGDGLGGQGGVNLGGFGGGYNFNGGDYGVFNGQIAIFRIYEDVNAPAGTGPLLSAADVLQNFSATTPGNAIFTNLGAGSNWTNPTNWFNNVAPTNYVDAYVGGTFVAVIDSVISNTVNRVTLGHALGTANGNGNLRMDAGSLTVDDTFNVGSAGSTGNLSLNSGAIDIGGDLVYGVTGNGGGEVNVFSGSVLNISGDIRERVTSVGAAQMYVDGGVLNVDGDIVVQSFRTGNLAGRTGSYTLKDGKRLDNTGTFFVGRLGAGTFTVEDGSLHLNTGGNDIRIAAEGAASTGILNVNHANALIDITTPRFLELGLLGNGRINLFDGTINSGITRFGQNGGGGVLNIQGGQFVARGDIRTGANAQQSAVNLSGGVLDLSASAATYSIRDLSIQDTGALRFQASAGGFTPLNVVSNANITSGSVEVLDPPAPGASTANTATWVASADTWDLDGTKWQNNLGSPGIPAVASGVIFTGAVFDVITTTAGSLSGGSNLTVGGDWEVTTPDPGRISVRRIGSQIEGGPAVAVIDDPAAEVSRNEDLHIFNAVGADASRLNVLDGALTLAPGSELILGGSIGGVLNHDGGTTTVETLRYGTGLAGFGGDVILRGGTLHVTGDIIENFINVNGAQMYIDSGTLVADGDITVQSFRTGQTAGQVGSYVQTNGQVIVNTGTFVVGLAGSGTHYLDDGKIFVKNNFVMGDNNGGTGVMNIGRPGTSPLLTVGSDNAAAGASAFDIGDQGPAIINLTNGTVIVESDVDFGRTTAAGGGLLHVAGGTFTALREMNVKNATNAMIHLEGGALELLGNNDIREILDYAQSNAVLRIGANDAAGDSTPLTVISNGVFGAGAEVDLVAAQVGLADIATNAVTWVGGNDTWDTDTNKWNNLAGAAYLPSNGQGFIPTGTVYPVITGANLVDTNLLQSANPDLALVSIGADTLGLRVDGVGMGGLPVTAIVDDPASIITRNGNLTISPEARADAAQLIHSNGTLNVSGDIGLGGTQFGFVHQDAGDITITGDLLFGPTFAATRGGTYNLNGGSLTVNAINEMEENVDSAQFHWNGGTLDVADSIIAQRFSVAEAEATNLTAVVTVPVMTTGDFTVGGYSNAVGHLTLRGADLVHRPRRIKLGQSSNGKGTLVIEDGTVIVGSGEVDIAGDNQGDIGTEGHLVVGTPGGPGPYISTTGANVEIGRAGRGVLDLESGTFEQLSSNLVLGQYAGSDGALNINGGVYRMTNPLSDFNMNASTGVVNQFGGVFEIPRNLNMGSAASSRYEYNLGEGLLTIGGNLDYRNNGTDVFNLTGGNLVFTNGAGTIFLTRTGNNQFNFFVGLLKNCGRFEGALVQQGGVLDIGASAGQMRVTGDYTGAAAATLKMELDWDPVNGPAVAGTDFDQLVVNGNADISGMTLDLSVSNPAINNAAAGTLFRILDATALTGTFAGFPLIDVGGTPFFVIHNSDSVDLMLFTNDATKDTDADGVPDLQELAFGTDAADSGTGPEALPKIERVDANTVRVLYRVQTASPLPLTYSVTTTTDLTMAAGLWTVLGAGAPSAVQPAGLPAGVTQMELDLIIDPDETRYYRVRVDL